MNLRESGGRRAANVNVGGIFYHEGLGVVAASGLCGAFYLSSLDQTRGRVCKSRTQGLGGVLGLVRGALGSQLFQGRK